MRAYIDSNILIGHLRTHGKAVQFFHGLQKDPNCELWTGAMQRMEVVFYVRPHEERDTMLLLSKLRTAPVDQEIIDKAGALFRRWNPSHGISNNDAILAATVMRTGGQIYTKNVKHYPMPDIKIVKPW